MFNCSLCTQTTRQNYKKNRRNQSATVKVEFWWRVCHRVTTSTHSISRSRIFTITSVSAWHMLLSISIDSPIRQSFNEYLGTKVTSLMTSETLHRFAVIDCDVFFRSSHQHLCTNKIIYHQNMTSMTSSYMKFIFSFFFAKEKPKNLHKLTRSICAYQLLSYQ